MVLMEKCFDPCTEEKVFGEKKDIFFKENSNHDNTANLDSTYQTLKLNWNKIILVVIFTSQLAYNYYLSAQVLQLRLDVAVLKENFPLRNTETSSYVGSRQDEVDNYSNCNNQSLNELVRRCNTVLKTSYSRTSVELDQSHKRRFRRSLPDGDADDGGSDRVKRSSASRRFKKLDKDVRKRRKVSQPRRRIDREGLGSHVLRPESRLDTSEEALGFHWALGENSSGQSLSKSGWLSLWSKPTLFGWTRDKTDPNYEMTVKMNGVYYIYSQVVFKIKRDHPLYFVTELVWSTGETWVPFAKCQVSSPSIYSQNQYVTCAASGLINLQRGNKVALRIKPVGPVDASASVHSEKGTYLGGFFIGY